MIDKVQKIREEVARIQLFSQSEVLKQVLDYIDKVQKEPASSIWHDASEKSNEQENVVIINPSDNTGEVLTRCTDVYQGRIWAYTSVLLNLDNSCNFGKNLQEEPVPKVFEDMLNAKTAAESLGISPEKHDKIVDECLYGKETELVDEDDLPVIDDKMTISKEWFEHCKKSWYNEGYIDGEYNRDRQFKEPVSEDLEKIVEEIVDPTVLNAYGVKEIANRLRRTMIDSVSDDLGEYINELSKQFPEVSFAKLSRIAVRVAKWQRNQDTKNKLPKVISRTDLDEYAYQCAYDMSNDWAIENPTWHDVEMACKLGANWQKANLWKPTDGDDLPEIDREVIALLDNGKVVFAHRPPEYWDGKNIITGEVTRYYPKTYDKGGWNIPNVKYWLDCLLPNMED